MNSMHHSCSTSSTCGKRKTKPSRIQAKFSKVRSHSFVSSSSKSSKNIYIHTYWTLKSSFVLRTQLLLGLQDITDTTRYYDWNKTVDWKLVWKWECISELSFREYQNKVSKRFQLKMCQFIYIIILNSWRPRFTHKAPTTMFGVSTDSLWPTDQCLIGSFLVPASEGPEGFWREIQIFKTFSPNPTISVCILCLLTPLDPKN